MVVVGPRCCNLTKAVVSRQKWFNSDNKIVFGKMVVVFEQSGCIRAKVVVFEQKWLYLGKIVVFGQKWLYSGKSCCIREK